jgi:hypothetical protein
MHSRKLLLMIFMACAFSSQAQEMQAKVIVLSQQIGTSVSKSVFTTLQTELNNFVNHRKWTGDVFQPQERIQCTFLLNLQSQVDDNTYKASLTVQAARPVFNASYQSPLVNYQDPEVTFKYVQYQPVEFNESHVTGNDPLAANLTAVFAYYVNVILGLDYDSFSLKAGEAYFQKALNIVNNAPENRNITGWKPFDGIRNRFWLATNLTDNKLNTIHDVFYEYYRSGMDYLYGDLVNARTKIIDAISKLQALNQENPNAMVMQFFIQNRSDELVGIFKKADPVTKSKAIEALSKIDVSNINKYRTELK